MAKSQQETPAEQRNVGGIVLALVLVVVSLIFIFSNSGIAHLRFLFINFSMPGWAWFLILLLVGFVIGSLFPWFRPRQKR